MKFYNFGSKFQNWVSKGYKMPQIGIPNLKRPSLIINVSVPNQVLTICICFANACTIKMCNKCLWILFVPTITICKLNCTKNRRQYKLYHRRVCKSSVLWRKHMFFPCTWFFPYFWSILVHASLIWACTFCACVCARACTNGGFCKILIFLPEDETWSKNGGKGSLCFYPMQGR